MSGAGNVLIHSILAHRVPDKLKRYAVILNQNGIPCRTVDASDTDYWRRVKRARAYIHHYVHREAEKQAAESVLPVIETVCRVPVFPNYATRWHFDDKVRQYYLLAAEGYPAIDSWIFWDKESAGKWLQGAELPLVFKLKAGAGSKNVLLVEDRKQALRLVDLMFGAAGVESEYIPDAGSLSRFRNMLGFYRMRQWIAHKRGAIHYQDIRPYWQRQRDYIMFQRFLPGNDFDTRITVIGTRAFAFRRWNRSGDFRASGSGKIDYDQKGIDVRCVSLAFKISEAFGFQSMAYDFLFDGNDNPQIGEISYTYLDKAVFSCPGYYDDRLNWKDGHFWPQFCILQDLLEEPDLVQPESARMLNI
jgi:glutathione synthase/RimK-type ligase-like ATP-grasp enzyme